MFFVRQSVLVTVLVFTAVLAGCAVPPRRDLSAPPSAEQPGAPVFPAPSSATPVAYQAPIADTPGPQPNPRPDPLPKPEENADSRVSPVPAAERTELSLDQLLAEVEARNPSLQAAVAAWNAAAQRYPQVVSLDDPVLNYMLAPTTGLGGANGGWMVQAGQHLPWPGKRDLRGSVACAEADAMRGDLGDARLKLAETARMAFYDYYLANHLADVNEANRRLLNEFRQLARTQYEASKATQQDVLQADVELAAAESRATELVRDRRVAVARINALLHQPPDNPLPSPPDGLAVPDALPAVDGLQEAAVRARPDLHAAGARAQAEEANLALARKEYYPDIDLMARYDAFMPENIRPAIGMQMNVPLPNGRRTAAVSEAEARLQQRRWEYQSRLDEVHYEVQSAHAQAEQARQVVGLYREKILPLSRRNVESARANYISGKLDFLRLIDAQRQLNAQQEMYDRAIAEYHRRLAELDRAVGQRVDSPR